MIKILSTKLNNFSFSDTRVLDDASATPCLKAKTILKIHGVISDSLNFLLDNMNTQRQNFLDEANISNERVKELENAAIRSSKEYQLIFHIAHCTLVLAPDFIQLLFKLDML